MLQGKDFGEMEFMYCKNILSLNLNPEASEFPTLVAYDLLQGLL